MGKFRGCGCTLVLIGLIGLIAPIFGYNNILVSSLSEDIGVSQFWTSIIVIIGGFTVIAAVGWIEKMDSPNKPGVKEKNHIPSSFQKTPKPFDQPNLDQVIEYINYGFFQNRLNKKITINDLGISSEDAYKKIGFEIDVIVKKWYQDSINKSRINQIMKLIMSLSVNLLTLITGLIDFRTKNKVIKRKFKAEKIMHELIVYALLIPLFIGYEFSEIQKEKYDRKSQNPVPHEVIIYFFYSIAFFEDMLMTIEKELEIPDPYNNEEITLIEKIRREFAYYWLSNYFIGVEKIASIY